MKCMPYAFPHLPTVPDAASRPGQNPISFTSPPPPS